MLKFSLSKVRPVMHALEFWSVGIIMALFYLLSCWYGPITEGIDNLLRRWQAWYDYLATFEEHKVRVEESLDFPVVMCARDVLQGENLDETVVRCLEDVHMKVIVEGFALLAREQQSEDRIPTSDHIMDKARTMFDVVVHNKVQSVADHLNSSQDEGHAVASLFALRYSEITAAFSQSYDPGHIDPIPSTTLPVFIQLLERSPLSAAFAILTMYSIRHHHQGTP